MTFYPVVEKFVSINGEGRHSGSLAVFIRFRKCNLKCSYCDTAWAGDDSCSAEMLSVEQLTRYAVESGVTDVTLTGGEPLLQSDIYLLIESLMKSGKRVEIETNGSISIKELSEKPFRPSFTLDYKLPSSCMESFMLTENYDFLQSGDTVKFVVGSDADLEKVCEIIKEFSLTEKCAVFISPVFNRISPEKIVEFMKIKRLNNVRLQLQLHKLIWGADKKGV